MRDEKNTMAGAGTGDGRSAGELAERAELARRVETVMADRGWSKREVARRTGLSEGALSQWLSGSYKGRFDTTNSKVQLWLDNLDAVDGIADSLPASPGFLPLSLAAEITHMLTVAQVLPGMVMITAEAGLGKTMAARQYVETRANAHLVTISPHTKSIHNMLGEIAAAIGIEESNQARMVRTIGKRLARVGAGTLLIVDEAQNLGDDAINQLRHFVDQFGCGVAMLGNTETYARFNRWGQGEKYGQLRRRIFKRLRRDRPARDDLLAFIGAWGIEDQKQIDFLTGVGMKPGALGQVDMTIKLARMAAQGARRPMTLADLKAAWTNRDVEAA